MMRVYVFFLLMFVAVASGAQQYVIVLGTAQDGGYPHAGCRKECCQQAWSDARLSRYVVSLALVDSSEKKWWLFEATPDIAHQLELFNRITKGAYNYLP